jgi:hypothetical protein
MTGTGSIAVRGIVYVRPTAEIEIDVFPARRGSHPIKAVSL